MSEPQDLRLMDRSQLVNEIIRLRELDKTRGNRLTQEMSQNEKMCRAFHQIDRELGHLEDEFTGCCDTETVKQHLSRAQDLVLKFT